MIPRGKWPPFPWNPADLDNPLIGRDDARRSLMGAFEDVVTDWIVRVQLLVSEYGMGKSRLMHAFVDDALARQPDTRVVRVKCPESGGRYRLWDAILREAFAIPSAAEAAEAGASLLRAVEEHVPEGAGEVTALIAYLVGYDVPGRPVLAVGADEDALVARCVGALGQLLTAMAFARPLLLIVSHANRASARDFALTSAIEATVKGRPLMMVVAGSPELTDHLPGWDRFPVTRLGALDAGEAERMLRIFLTGLHTPAPRDLVERILAGAGGNPYAIKATVRFLQEAGGIAVGPDGWDLDQAALAQLEVPENLEGVVHARIGKLAPAERQILAQAAVVGREFWLGALVAIGRQGATGLPQDLDADVIPKRIRLILAKLVAQRFIEPRTSRLIGEEAFVFRSRVHWQLALQILPATVRQRHHRVVGAWLKLHAGDDERPFLFELARHAEGAGLPGDAASYHLRAGRVAAAENQTQAALHSLERAHALLQPDQIATRLNVLFELGDVHAYAGATDDAKRYYRDALELAWRMRARSKGARALVRLAEVEQTRGEFEDARGHFDAGLRLFEATQDQPGVASSCTALGRLHWMRGEFDQALRCYKKAEHIYQRLRNDRGIGEVVHAMGAVHYDRGDVAVAEELYQRALELRRASDDRRGLARTLNNLGIAWMGRRIEASVDVWKEALELAHEIGDLGLQATLADNLGEALVLIGRYDEADAYLGRAVELAELTGRRQTLVDALRNQGLLRLALGQYDGAERVLTRARGHARSLGLPRLSAMVERATGDLIMARVEATGVIGEEGSPGALNRAETAYRHAADAFGQAGYDLEAATSLERLAEMLELAGRREEAGLERARAARL
ncbi:MAG: tetratricopeptide repeat protein, partial [Deltaproteobacteria bacterium]